ncbi:MAG: TetR/AcrR family transcriptional regulator [Paludibacteraceae bacterium]|nr:TetR/AcrR family transcriptional regulator [Paludibacteraceae bacterium]
MSDNQRENIIKAASEKMRLLGIRSVSIDDLCHDLGISKKTFYVYFETKDALVDALLRHREQDVIIEVERKNKGKHIVDLLLGLIKVLKDLKDVRQVPPLLYDLKKYYPQLLQDHLQRLKLINRDIAARYLQQGVQEGFFRADVDVEVTARIVAALHQVMMDKMAEAQNHPSIISDTKIAMDIFFRGLISEQGAALIQSKLNAKS